MGHGPRFRVPMRRRQTGRTNYRHRLALLKSRVPRLVVRRSNRAVTVQFIDFTPKGDVVRVAATSRELAATGWDHAGPTTPAAYLTGLLAGTRAKAAGLTQAVLDLGRFVPTPGGRAFAALKGVLDAGVKVPHDPEVLPDTQRLEGEHLADAPLAKFKNSRAKIQGGTPA